MVRWIEHSDEELKERLRRLQSKRAAWRELLDTYGTIEEIEDEIGTVRWLLGE